MSASLTATWVEQNQCPLHQSILLIQGPIHEIFIKKYWELTKPWKWLLFSFLVFGFWLLGCSKIFFFGFSVWKKPRRFIWGRIYSCTMDSFFRTFKKAVSELICTRLYVMAKIEVFLTFMLVNFLVRTLQCNLLLQATRIKLRLVCQNWNLLIKKYI